MYLTAVHFTAVHFTAVYLTAVHLGSEYLNAVHLTQFKLTAFNLTATDTNQQAQITFNFLDMNEWITESHGRFVEMLSHLKRFEIEVEFWFVGLVFKSQNW